MIIETSGRRGSDVCLDCIGFRVGLSLVIIWVSCPSRRGSGRSMDCKVHLSWQDIQGRIRSLRSMYIFCRTRDDVPKVDINRSVLISWTNFKVLPVDAAALLNSAKACPLFRVSLPNFYL